MDLGNIKETIRINKGKVHIKVVAMTGKEGNFFVTLSPSLNVSGYGRTKEDSKTSFHENVTLFCHDLMALSKEQIEHELSTLGFKKEIMRHKNFSKSYVDENGHLQNFEEGTLEKNIHEETACA
ncbi:MAG: hypothetical protein HYX40_04530 [Sphingobacteriales bacterium]|nr:hypothetical protein [Sphingobacteriales bacterium]